MNTSESFDLLSDVLLDDERIVSIDEREFLADLLRHSENNPKEANPEVTRAIARIAGEIVVQRAVSLVGDGILRRLVGQSPTVYDRLRRKEHGLFQHSKSANLPPKPPKPTPPTPGPTPGGMSAHSQKSEVSCLTPKPPQPTPPSPGPAPGMQTVLGPKGILNPDVFEHSQLLPPRCVVFEEFLAPAELQDLLSYTLAHQEHFVVSEVISPGVANRSTADFEYRRSQVLMDLGSYQENLVNRLRSTLPRVLPRLEIEPFSISRIETQITASNDGDFFRWHADNGEGEVARRQVTFVYFFYREPKVFEGGELRIQAPSWNENTDESGNYYNIVPQQNQVVLFDSSLTHEIAPVKCPSGKFADSRFTVNGWISR